ncbi:3-methyladenine DNA glycosylase [Georgenia sp. EYE_87]|uniref:3-methyladenine DNA glycosylase n=1 Tax=Georgenia sp. EYE_87 TaxID=2853448 RepID=UPI0020033F16|nr:3-methyladenine DNA glycosylase [Georgenia sp. EYE_87]MCK6212009.1 3-methyladenine DNA glycosylase [Georgenia sp. EYE_87]
MLAPTAPPRALAPAEWTARASAHAARADALTAARRERRSRHEKHPVEDFLFEYYPVRPAQLARWHPGVGVALLADDDPDVRVALAVRSEWRWHTTRLGDDGAGDDGAARAEQPDDGAAAPGADGSRAVVLDVGAFLSDRGEGVRWLDELLRRTAARPAHLGCLGLHEWAMVYRQREHRHPLPLRLGQAGTDAVVEAHPVRCSHFDAFRFFTPAARPLNRLQPERATQPDLEQPGCLHANMDLLKAALKLGPACPGELLLDCFELARDIRVLDMRASPYDVTSLGHAPVAIETPGGRAEYVARQREFAERAAPLRARLLEVTSTLLAAAPPPRGGTS